MNFQKNKIKMQGEKEKLANDLGNHTTVLNPLPTTITQHVDENNANECLHGEINAASSKDSHSILHQETQQTATDESAQLHEYLLKFVQLVPHLQEINREEKIHSILSSSAAAANATASSSSPSASLASLNRQYASSLLSPTSSPVAHANSLPYAQQLDGLQNLNLNSATSISDLQVLQSVLDYIADLKSKVGN